MSGNLAPAIPPEQLYPADAVYMARTNLFETRMLGYEPLNLDTVTSHLVGCLNGRAAIRHEAGGCEEIFRVFRRSGIDVAEETLTYRTADEAESAAKTLVSQGKRLFSPYPLPQGWFPDDAHLVPPELYRSLNAKINLGAIVQPEYLPRRQPLNYEELDRFEFAAPVFLKAAGDAATGWGYAVQACPDKVAFDNARRWFYEHRDSVPGVFVEEWVDVSVCWCVGIVVCEEETICIGGAEQLFSSPAKQSGSMIDPENLLPEEGWALAVQIGEAARKRGYRGLAGLDIGLRRDGRLTVFDPNFRFNSSSAQLLFHGSAAARTGLPASCSFQATPGGAFGSLAKQLEAPISEGWFVPTRIFDGEKHPLSMGKHIITGFILGKHRLAAQESARLLERTLEI